jgi:rhomboid protease GluP
LAAIDAARTEPAARSAEPATTGVLVLTSTLTALSIVNPNVLRALMRTPEALEGEVWRLVTPLFVERGGWPEITLNLVTLALVGAITERLWGSRRWLWFYFAGGLSGELAGLAWRPLGTGSSVAMLGLFGACAIALVRRRGPWPLLTVLVVLTGVTLTALKNLHGPPLLVGAAVASVFARRRGPVRRTRARAVSPRAA